MKPVMFLRLMRPAHWAKNVFVLAPLVFSFKLMVLPDVKAALIAAVVFCLTASAIYIVNDLADVKIDRQHPKKRHRPLASGGIGVAQAVSLLAVLAALDAGILFYAGFDWTFFVFLGLYILLSLAYSFGLKQVALLELFIVASGYILRLLAGCAVIGEMPSPWILAATGTLALLITAGKRRAEMAENHDPDQLRRSLRGYNLPFLDSMITMLAAVTVVTYLLFTTSDYAIDRFHSTYFVSTSVFVLYGVLRYLQRIKVTTGAGDPTALVLTDPGLLCAVLGWLATCVGLIYF